ncbi:hypothetical protein HMPREF1552_01511 [Leptotrichia sp. oral taxon 879 str. F0557]|jgi:hypothetical protein|nr:hypothetical protein HMPREF1552_01511 [Leptotrichia sp. oral taxon 879 str. F0557]
MMKKHFYFVDDICKILGFSKSEAYKIIRELNAELEKKGYRTNRGRIVASYFEERYKIV